MAGAHGAGLLERIERWAAALEARGLARELAAGALREVLEQSRGERLDLADDPLLVAMLCGPTAVGKSSLINALAGAQIAAPGLGAATSAPTLYVHERDDPARLFEYSQALGQLGRDPARIVRHARDPLLHKVLVDTPDIDSAVRTHRETTQALVHAADLVLFVTSPEKYKTIEAARWLAEQRQQRAIAFVLNKWDRDALGLRYAERERIVEDFRATLRQIGFLDPIVFKVSSLTAISPVEPGREIENELTAVAAWLSAGLDRTAAAAIRDRRRRRAWGRVGGAVAALVPAPAGQSPVALAAAEGWTAPRTRAVQLARAEALLRPAPALQDAARPVTPGLLGSWTRLARRVGGAAGAVRGLIAGWGAGADRSAAASGPLGASGFGDAAAMLLQQATRDLVTAAEAGRLVLGPVAAAWEEEVARLRRNLGRLPDETAAELSGAALRLSLRRLTGVAALYAVECLIAVVLLLALWRVGAGFVSGDYASLGLLVNTVALLFFLLLLGQFAGNLFFPPWQDRFRRLLAHQAEERIGAAFARGAELLHQQLDATDRLAAEGRGLLSDIDALVGADMPALTPADDIARLFPATQPAAAPHHPVSQRS
ncbi:MAG: 50S ribosome-binding GTPase [Alphaproteobacteria bacterium]|nr:50S ribosome-binding GTPase [Alphaproteobacteria bacterium]